VVDFASLDPLRLTEGGAQGLALAALLAASTLVSEDLACIGAGVLAAQGDMSFAAATLACLAGIFAGDMLLFFAGRLLGRRALSRAPLRWFVRPEDVLRGSRWLDERGAAVILFSRFVPGARLPTYFAAGLLDTSAWRFAAYFLAACALWTPLLVGMSMLLGGEAVRSALGGGSAAAGLAAAGVVAYAAARIAPRLATRRGRRLLVGAWRRLARWEFWPPWLFYPPVVCYIAWLALRHRSLTAFMSANPAIPAGGFVGESKFDILRGLAGSPEYVARAALLGGSLAPEERVARACRFLEGNGLAFPVVLKPDVGQRGSGVTVVRSARELEERVRGWKGDAVIQEHVAGAEFGVFYYRRPGEERGRIFSITDKQFPTVTGDGRSTLEELILADERAVCMAAAYFAANAHRLLEVPPEGERVRLVEIGSHCRGALFLDGAWAKTAELEEAIDRVSRGFDGFYFGRYDIRTPSVEDFLRGRNFKVVELNGVTSEATHIYDPSNGLLDAYRVVFEQWRLAFEIGAANRARG
jgi:membrane protein DedA with SNARE-associated domain